MLVTFSLENYYKIVLDKVLSTFYNNKHMNEKKILLQR